MDKAKRKQFVKEYFESRGKYERKQMYRDIGKGVASISSAGLCCFAIYCTHGETGLGWFCFSMFLIWAC